jgi:RecA-family ATPase
VSLAGLDALMAVPDVKTKLLRPTAVFEALKSEIARIRPTLIVLDTLADIFGGEENQRAQARQFIGMLRGIAIENNCAVLLLAHPSLSGMASGSGSSGSTGWNNSVRSRLYLERAKGDDGIEGDPDVRVLKVKKSNYSRADVEIELRWQHGIFVAPSDAGTGSSFFRKAAAEEKADRIFLDMLAEFEAEGRHVSSSKTAANAAPAAFAGSPRAQGIKKQAFRNAMERLFASKKIRNHEFGSPSRPRSRIVLAKSEQETGEDA